MQLLEELVFTLNIKDVLIKYMDGMVSPILPLWKFPESKMASSKACAKNDDIAKRTGAEVENALSGTDASDLKASFRQALYFSTPPLILLRSSGTFGST